MTSAAVATGEATSLRLLHSRGRVAQHVRVCVSVYTCTRVYDSWILSVHVIKNLLRKKCVQTFTLECFLKKTTLS